MSEEDPIQPPALGMEPPLAVPAPTPPPPASPPVGSSTANYGIGPTFIAQSGSQKERTPNKTIPVTLALVLLIGVAVGVFFGVSSPKSSSPNRARLVIAATRMTSLRILGGPVVADGRLLVIDIKPDHLLELSSIDPVTEDVLWKMPYSQSMTTPGQAFDPSVFGNIVVDMQSVGKNSPFVNLLGVNIATGHVVWTFDGNGAVGDSPTPCGQHAFCLSWQTVESNDLIQVSTTNGDVIRTDPNVERNLGALVYQTWAQGTTTLVQIGSKGQVLWTRPAASIFGSTSDNANEGWNIDRFGGLDVGSLSPSLEGDTWDAGLATTSGFSIATGKTKWTDPGLYNCEGTLEIFSSPVICDFSGIVKGTSASDFSGLTLKIEGFDVTTGKIKWSVPVQNAEAMMDGNIPFVDADHVVVETAGSYQLLDLTTGKVTHIGTQVYWCASIPDEKVTAPSGSGYANYRAGTNQYFGCNAAGKRQTIFPPSQPSIVGIKLGGRFFWPSTDGLKAETALGSSTSK
jgi:hypothetical protein